MKRIIHRSYDEVVAAVPAALAAEGFGVLTEIDVRETLAKKLGVDFPRYKIFGACNPALAHRALSAELDVGVMLPCNVVVYAVDAGITVVNAIDPLSALAAKDPVIQPIAEEVQARLARAIEQV